MIKAILFDFWGVIYNPTTDQPMAGLTTLLQQLRQQQIACAIVSSCNTMIIESFLTQHHLTEYFSFIVGIETVAQPKPNPAGYLKAATHFNLAPTQCLVIDDSPTTITQAAEVGFQTKLFDKDIADFT